MSDNYQRSIGEEGMLFLLDAVFSLSNDPYQIDRDERYSRDWFDATIQHYDTGFDMALLDGRTASVSVADAEEERREFAELVAGRVLRRMIAAGPGGRFQEGANICTNAVSDEGFINEIQVRAAAIDAARGVNQ
jgi:hypothetical protein